MTNFDRQRGRKIEIFPTDEQKEIFNRCFDIYRSVYNICLSIQKDNHSKNLPYISEFKMMNIITNLKNNDPDYEWLGDIPHSIMIRAVSDIDNAFLRFFKKQNNYPKYKKKKTAKKSFAERGDRCYFTDSAVRLCGIGLVDTKGYSIPTDSKLYNVRISYDNHSRYYMSFTIETEKIDTSNIQTSDPIGIDVGVRNMITTSEGNIYNLSDTSRLDKRLRRMQRRVSKHVEFYKNISIRTKTKYEDIPKSKNYQKLLNKEYKLYQKIHNKNMNDIHCATKEIVDKNPSTIVIENISVSDMLKSKWAHKYIPQLLFYEVHRQIKYKAEDRDIPVIIADKYFPSSQICSNCGHKQKIYASHTFICKKCGLRLDRDINAACNLKNLAYQN